jgi:hypothetical protein
MTRYEYVVEGLDKAASRLEQSRLSREAVDSFIAVAECLLWLMVIDDRLYRLRGGAYQTRRATDGRGSAMPGMRHAWNLLKHADLNDLVDVSEGAGFPMQFPLVWIELVWKPFRQLPLLDADKRSSHQEARYQSRLEGKPVRLTLVGAIDFARLEATTA